MATSESKLSILIEAKNRQASAAIKQTTAEIKEIDKVAGQAASGLSGLLGVAGIAGLGALAAGAAGAAYELAELGNQAQRVEGSYARLATQAGQAPAEMLATMKEASRGTIAEVDLMLAANKSMLLGVADTGEELGTLLKISGERAKAMGLTTGQAFSDLVTAIGRQSVMIADNLGITLSLEQAYDGYAQSIGTTAAQLTDAQKKQAFLNEVMRQSQADIAAAERSTNDATLGVQNLTIAWQELRTEVGKEIAPQINQASSDAAGTLGWINTFLFGDDARADRAISDARIAIKQIQDQLAQGLITDTARGQLEQDLRAQIATLGDLTGANQRARFETGEVEAAFLRMGSASTVAGSGLGQVGLSADAAKERLAALKQQADETLRAINAIKSGALGSLESAASQAVSIMGSSEVSRIYAEQKKRLDAQITALEAVGYQTDELKFKSQELAEKAAQPFTLAVEASREAEKQAKSYGATMTDEARAAQQAFEDLKGTVAGVLQGALDPGVGVNPDDVLEKLGLPREDAINESARRLADIAQNGLKGQDWLGDFANDVPDIWRMIRTAQNPQEEAAYLLRDFQDGLLTAAIDKDKAKAIVKRQILGDQNMAAMAQEIATELAAEMGVPMQQALAAAQGALGGGGTLGVGGDAAQGFTDGANANLDETNAGGTFVDKFIAQARASYASLKTAGADGGKQWGDGFMATVGENVPPALISLLTNLVTPGVMAQFAQRGTLTGATP